MNTSLKHIKEHLNLRVMTASTLTTKQTGPPLKDFKNKKQGAMNKNKEITRQWIIIEDDQEKAKYFIANIRDKFKQDNIHWLYTEFESVGKPSFVHEHDDGITFKDEVDLEEGKGYQLVEIAFHFYYCYSRQKFTEETKKINFQNAIILLDVKHPVFGNKHYLDEGLGKFIKEQLGHNFEENKLCVSIVSGQAHYGSVIEALQPYQNRINRKGSGDWVFAGKKRTKDCREAVISSHDFYEECFLAPSYNLNNFFEDMSRLDRHACHNWDEGSARNLRRYIEMGRWDEKWKMPIQLGYLIKLLNYQPNDFVKEFNLKNKQGKFYVGHPIGECLKIMGTMEQKKDFHGNPKTESEGSKEFSYLATLFVCWAAYRHTILNNRQDELFIKQINNLLEASDRAKNDIARNSSIIPKQEYKTLRTTINLLYEMMCDLFRSTEIGSQGQDNLIDLYLDESGLEIELQINPKSLFENIKKEKQKRLSKNNNDDGGGNTTKKILRYIEQSSFCDCFSYHQEQFLGFDTGLKICANGDDDEGGTKLKFGHDTYFPQT